MKDVGAKCFRRRALRYGGQVGFTKMDSGEIRCIKKSAFAAGEMKNAKATSSH